MAVLRDLGASLANARFQKLVLYNTHGGNTALIDVMARDLRAEFGLRTFALHGSGGFSSMASVPRNVPTDSMPARSRPRCCWQPRPNSWTRTAYTTNYIADVAKPELLLPENAPATFAWLTRDIASSGVLGDPRPATAENGARWLRAGCDQAGGGPGGDGALPKSRPSHEHR